MTETLCEECDQPHEHLETCSLFDGISANPKYPFKRDLMREFNALWSKTTQPQNMSSVGQISDTTIHVSLRQYPDQGQIHDVSIYDEFNRLRHFGWQLRYIVYDKHSTLHIYFEKVDWRSVGFYGLVPTKHNNEKDLWWLNPDAKAEELGI